MVRFGNKPPNITVTPAPKRKKKPKPSGPPGFGGEPGPEPTPEPELSETPVIDESQATAPVEPQTSAEAHKALLSIGGVESAPPPTESYPEPKVTVPEKIILPDNPPLSKCRAKPLKKKKGKNKHSKKKRRHGR